MPHAHESRTIIVPPICAPARKVDRSMSAPVNARARIALVLVFTCSLFLALPAAPTGAAPLDTEAELRVVKAAYDNLRKYLYTEPDTVALLTNAQQAAQKALDQSVPL